MFWLPKVPQEALNIKFVMAGTALRKSSDETLQPADTEGKKPYLLPLAKREDPS